MRINLENPKRDGHKTKLSFVVFTFLSLWMFLASVNTGGGGRIENISLKREGNFTHLTIYGNKPFEFSHSTEEAKGGRPYRLIIDCQDMIFGLPQHDFKEGLPGGIIEGIRTSQFQVVPERIVRVVLDLRGPVVYKVVETGVEKKATIAIFTSPAPDFPPWQAVKEVKGEKDQPAEVEKIETPPQGMKIASPIEEKKEEAPTLVPPSEKTSEWTYPETKVEQSVKKKEVFRKAVSYADTGMISSPESKPILISQTLGQKKNIKEDIIKEKPASLTISQKTGSKSESSSAVSSEQVAPKTEPSSDKRTAQKMEVKKTEPDVLSFSAKSVPKPASQAKGEKPPLSSKEILFEQSFPEKKISRSSAPLGPFPEEKTYVAKTGENLRRTKTGTSTEKKKEMQREVRKTEERRISRILGTKGASAQESDTLLEGTTPIQIAQPSETELIATRKIITYNPETRRDPFLPLTDKEQMSFGQAPSPWFENLKLVGIIKDKLGNQALLEDEIGFGYILKSGDKIKNGYVMSIEDDKVVFHVEEYGGYKTMTLQLNPEY